MAEYYVPVEMTREPYYSQRRWFFLIVEASDAYDAWLKARPTVEQRREARKDIAWWWPVAMCPSVEDMQELRIGIDRSRKRAIPQPGPNVRVTPPSIGLVA